MAAAEPLISLRQQAPAPDSGAGLLAQLCARGCLSAQQASHVEQVRRALRMGAVPALRLLRFVGDLDIAQALAQQHGLPFELPQSAGIDPAVLACVPFTFAQQHRVLPLRRVAGTMLVALDDPGQPELLPRLRRHVAGPVQWVVAPTGALAHAIESAYRFAEHPSADALQRELEQPNAGADGARLVQLAVAAAIELQASDLHITPSGFATLLYMRIDGVLQLRHVLPPALHVKIASSLKVACGMDIAESRRPQDGSYSVDHAGRSYDLRVSTMPTTHGENLVVRVLSMHGDVLPLEACGFRPEQVRAIEGLLRAPSGLVLATGPTGCGKTTTLYAGLRTVNALERNVMTVEDPVEYNVPLIRQVRLNERAGMSFASAVRAFLRQDPDVMLVGEIRDGETASMAVRAAQTGHLVPGTLHTNDAIGAVARLRDLGVEPYLLAASLNGVIAQRLLRRTCAACRPDGGPAQAGCPRCHGSGYRGRVAVAEVLVVDADMRTLIEQGAPRAHLRTHALSRGYSELRAEAQRLVQSGTTDAAEVRRVLGDGG